MTKALIIAEKPSVAADIAKALKGGRHMRIDFKRMQKPQLTEAERVQLKAIEARVLELKKQLKAMIDAKGTPAEIETLKALLKAKIAEREALVKAFRARARAQFLVRLDNLIDDARKELTFLNGLLAALP